MPTPPPRKRRSAPRNEPAVVDEHPATAAATSTNLTVSVLKRVLIASLDPWGEGCDSSRMTVRRIVTGFGSPNLRLVQVRPVRYRQERTVVDPSAPFECRRSCCQLSRFVTSWPRRLRVLSVPKAADQSALRRPCRRSTRAHTSTRSTKRAKRAKHTGLARQAKAGLAPP